MRAHTQDRPAWLCANGGPIVRYRTATELPGDTSRIDLARLQRELLACDEVQRWLDNLGAGPIHHSKDTAAENALAKLCEYGLRAGMPALDGKVLPFVELGAHFAAVRRSPWFRDSLAHLEGFRTSQGTYRFPTHYLQERRTGYYLYAGAHMGLGENRRTRQALEIESTYGCSASSERSGTAKTAR